MIVRIAMRFVVACAFVLGLALVASAQSSITGTVTDATGAVVPDVKVVAQMADTNLERETQTTGTGFYSIPNLVPGVYNLTIRKTGFRSEQALNVTLTVGQTLTLDVTLAVSVTLSACSLLNPVFRIVRL